jgi:hypothetical protein
MAQLEPGQLPGHRPAVDLEPQLSQLMSDPLR